MCTGCADDRCRLKPPVPVQTPYVSRLWRCCSPPPTACAALGRAFPRQGGERRPARDLQLSTLPLLPHGAGAAWTEPLPPLPSFGKPYTPRPRVRVQDATPSPPTPTHPHPHHHHPPTHPPHRDAPPSTITPARPRPWQCGRRGQPAPPQGPCPRPGPTPPAPRVGGPPRPRRTRRQPAARGPPAPARHMRPGHPPQQRAAGAPRQQPPRRPLWRQRTGSETPRLRPARPPHRAG